MISARRLVLACTVVLAALPLPAQQENPYTTLLREATEHARQHHAPAPVLSPVDASVVTLATTRPGSVMVDVPALHALGIQVVPWTTNDSESMRAQIRAGVDGLISDRPDLLRRVLQEEVGRAQKEDSQHLQHFDVVAHRGGRRLRPENTLPSFESGLDQLATTLETDTGVSTDHVSTIWHDQFYHPDSCRRADGQPYTMENRIYLGDISSTNAAKTLICDKVRLPLDQTNDLSLSPVSVAFAKKDGMPSPYAPTNVDQLFRFVDFYVAYYRTGAGRNRAEAKLRADNAAHVRFNLETKIKPEMQPSDIPANLHPEKWPKELFEPNHTVGPDLFVDTLAGTILRHHMENRAEIQSFDFRTLQLVEEKYPKIPTYYLTEDAMLFYTPFVPASLRLKVR